MIGSGLEQQDRSVARLNQLPRDDRSRGSSTDDDHVERRASHHVQSNLADSRD